MFSSISSGISGARSLSAGMRSGSRYGATVWIDAQPEHADQLIASRLRDVANARRLLEHLLRLLDDALADRRHGDLGLAALEELRIELVFELLYRHRQRGLADEAALRRASEAALLRDRDDVAQLVEGHFRRFRGTPRNRVRLPGA